MAATTLASLAGLFQTTVFKDLLQGEFTHRLAYYNSILMKAPDSLISPNHRGTLVSFRKMNVLTGDMDQITNGLTTTINSVVPWLDTAAWVEREKGWGVEDMVATVTGDDHTRYIAALIAEYLALQVHKSASAVLTGVCSTALASTHVYDDGANLINRAGVMKAKLKLGDNASKLTAMVMNSKVKGDALEFGIAYHENSTSDMLYTGDIPKILGMTISETDLLTMVGAQYPSYLGMMGSMIYQFRKRVQQSYSNENVIDIGVGDIELSRDSVTNGGQDRLIFRTSYLVHVPGVQFDGTVASNPTDTELATGTTWTKTAPDDKLIPLVQYLCA